MMSNNNNNNDDNTNKRKREDLSNLIHRPSTSQALQTINNNDNSKRFKSSDGAMQVAVSHTDNNSLQLTTSSPNTVPRTSSLFAPIVQLKGHENEVLTCKFSPNGEYLATGSHDKTILLWSIFGAQCENLSQLRGHKNAVLELCWSNDSTRVYSVSADRSVIAWDPIRHKRIRRYRDHDAIVNCCSSTASLRQLEDSSRTQTLFVTGSDDRSAKIFDTRNKDAVASLSCKYPVLSVAMGENEIYTAGIDDVIKVWDMRTNTISYTLQGHTDGVTGLKLSPDGNSLLSCSLDMSLRIWDVRPFLPAAGSSARLLKNIEGAVVHGLDKNLLRCAWSSNGSKISCGSSDIPTHVYIWDSKSTNLVYRLPGHRGTVNEVDFHPVEPIIASASSDRTIYLGEIEP